MQQDIVFYSFLALTLILIPVLYKKKLLTLPSGKETSGVALMTPVIGFLLFLSTLAYVPRWVKKAMHYGDTHGLSSFSLQEVESWPQLIALVVALLLLVGFSAIHSKEIQSRIWSSQIGFKNAVKSFLKGMLYCIIAYPIVMTLVYVIHFGVEALGYKAVAEQAAVAHVKALKAYPVLFWSTIAALVTIVPIIEELLFRGFLQNFFQSLAGPKWAIFLAAMLFSIFHYADMQSYTNIELMAGLFLYAIFLGIFYCRNRSLWVPIGMHASFNGLSLFFMIFVGSGLKS